MEAMRESWTDERLGEFRTDVNRRFDDVGRRFDELKGDMDSRFGKVDTELHRINDRLDTLTKAIVFSTLTLSGSFLAGFIAIAFTSH